MLFPVFAVLLLLPALITCAGILKRVKGRTVNPLSSRLHRSPKLSLLPLSPITMATEHHLADSIRRAGSEVGFTLPSETVMNNPIINGEFMLHLKIQTDGKFNYVGSAALIQKPNVMIDILHAFTDNESPVNVCKDRFAFIDAIRKTGDWGVNEVDNVLAMNGVATDTLSIYLDPKFRIGAIFKRNRLVHFYHDEYCEY